MHDEVDGIHCSSVCDECGRICEGFPITDLQSLQIYGSRKCAVILGDLLIDNLPSTITLSDLEENLHRITDLHGVLRIKNNRFIPDLSFMKNLHHIYGGSLLNNPVLVDARIPTFMELTYSIEVEGCDRLCPSRWLSLDHTFNEELDASCANAIATFVLHVDGIGAGSFTAPTILQTVLQNLLRNYTKGEVCLFDHIRIDTSNALIYFKIQQLDYLPEIASLEGGSNWHNFVVTLNELRAHTRIVDFIHSLIKAFSLNDYAKTSAEVGFFAQNNISVVGTPYFSAPSDGYNGANRLIGMINYTKFIYSIFL